SLPDVVALSDGRFMVVYQSDYNAAGDLDIRGQFVNPDGTLSGGTVAIAAPSGLQGDPAVAAGGGGSFTTVWQDFGTSNSSPDTDPDIYYAVTNANGTNTVNRTLLMDSAAILSNPDIATMQDGRQIVVAE